MNSTKLLIFSIAMLVLSIVFLVFSSINNAEAHEFNKGCEAYAIKMGKNLKSDKWFKAMSREDHLEVWAHVVEKCNIPGDVY